MREWPRRVALVALVAAGAGITLHPVATTLATDREVRHAAREHARAASGVPASALAARLASARRYNAALPPHLFADPWGHTPGRVDGPAHDAYRRELSGADVMARLRIPSIGVDLPVRHDADDPSLRLGVGHMYGTALPVGGPGTHAVLAGHTGWRGATFFDRLPELRAGEVVAVDVAAETLTYRVTSHEVVPAWRVDAVRPVAGRDRVTLVTCITPRGQDKARLLVRAERVATPAPAPATAGVAGVDPLPAVQRWMWLRLLVTVAALLLLLTAAARWTLAGRRARPEVAG